MDYDTLEPEKTITLASFGGIEPEPYPKEGVSVVRGHIQMPETGIYEFRAGYAAGEENIMTIDGTEVHRRLPGGVAVKTPIKLEAGKKVPFQITHLNQQGNSLGWLTRIDIPGTLKSLVLYDGKFQYLVDENKQFVPRDDVWYTGVDH